ncbi:MAG: hypothetical protein WBM08_10625 [Prochlorococcaceae cyanobacterium]
MGPGPPRAPARGPGFRRSRDVAWLRAFQDNEKTIPTILTTSQELSTGVDARNVRAIVLLRPVNSLIEFKQIIGRGTRLFDGKDCFTIYAFVNAHHHLSVPEWNGEPLEPEPVEPKAVVPVSEPTPTKQVDDQRECAKPRPTKAHIQLGDGKERSIQHMLITSFWHPDGKPMSCERSGVPPTPAEIGQVFAGFQKYLYEPNG